RTRGIPRGNVMPLRERRGAIPRRRSPLAFLRKSGPARVFLQETGQALPILEEIGVPSSAIRPLGPSPHRMAQGAALPLHRWRTFSHFGRALLCLQHEPALADAVSTLPPWWFWQAAPS